MNGKKARAIRKAMLAGATELGATAFTTTPIYEHGDKMLHFKFSYHSIGGRRLYKIGKKIYKKYGVLPIQEAKQ